MLRFFWLTTRPAPNYVIVMQQRSVFHKIGLKGQIKLRKKITSVLMLFCQAVLPRVILLPLGCSYTSDRYKMER